MVDYAPTLMPLPATAQTNMITTPEALKAQRDYAKALLYGNGQQSVQHWTQGVSNMVSALMGGASDYNATQKEMAARQVAGAASNPLNAQGGETPARSFSEGPSSEGQQSADGGDLSKDARAIASIESGKRGYSELGMVIPKTGDRAYGKYQVMGANIPEWTQAALGQRMTPDQFLNDPKAQEAVFAHKFGEYKQKYGPEGAAKAWFAGEKGMNNPSGHDPLGTTVQGYGQKFSRAMAFNGEPASSSSPAAAAIAAAALRGDPPQATQVAGGARTPAYGVRDRQNPNGSGIYIDPELVRPKVQYSREQLNTILSSPWIDNGEKAAMRQEGINQNQPLAVPFTGGQVLVSPRDPTRQQLIQDLQKGKAELGDMKVDTLGVVSPKQGGGFKYDVSPPTFGVPVGTPGVPGPRSDAAPPAGGSPAAAPQGTPAPAAAPVQAAAENVPAAPAGKLEAPAAAPVQVASLDPTAGIASTAEKPAEAKGAGYEHFNPATGKLEKASDTVETAEATPQSERLAKFAQATPPGAGGGLNLSMFPPQMTEDYARKKAFDLNTSVNEDAQKKAVEFSAKKYDTLSTQAAAARKQMPNLDYASALMNDPNFYSGIAANEVTAWKQLKAAMFGDSALAAAPNEVFNKVISGSILDNMKTALGGLGQVRLAEIDLLKKANASTQNTPAANRALLELSKRAVQSLDNIDQMGQAYYSGDEVLDPVSGKVLMKANADRNGEIQPRHGLDVGFDKLARKYALDHPTLSPDDIKNYEEIFKTGVDPRGGTTAPAQTGEAPKVGATKMFDDGKGGKVEGVWDGKSYQPKAK